MSTAHKTARAGPFLRGFTNSPWTGLKVSPRNVAQDTTENSELDNLQDRLKSTVRLSKED